MFIFTRQAFVLANFLFICLFLLSFISVLNKKKTKRINVQGKNKLRREKYFSGGKDDEEKILRDVV